MVRVAALQNAIVEGDAAPDISGLTPQQQAQRIGERAHAMVDQLYAVLAGEILPPLAERGVRLVRPEELDPVARGALGRYFRDEVLPALTPLAIDTSRPFPMLAGLSLNLAVLLAPAEDGRGPAPRRRAGARPAAPARAPARARGMASAAARGRDPGRARRPVPGQAILEPRLPRHPRLRAGPRRRGRARLPPDGRRGAAAAGGAASCGSRSRRASSDALLRLLKDRLEVGRGRRLPRPRPARRPRR